MLANASYGCMLDGGFGFERTRWLSFISSTTSKKLKNKRELFSLDYAVRLQRAQIECCDAFG
jgi:hypothetical protein